MTRPAFLTVMGFLVALTIWAVVAIVQDENEDERRRDEINSHIGERVTIDDSTFTIVNYHGWKNQYELSNGKSISVYFVVKNLKKRD